MKSKFHRAQPLTEEQQAMMQMLLDNAKKIREGYKYSEDEKMLPFAFIFADGLTMMALHWKDNKEKYRMAAAANALARQKHATSLSFVTDSRWVEGKNFSEYFRLDPPEKMGTEKFQREYHRILAAYGGEVKNFPREIWSEAVVVFTNGPDFPLTVQMAAYVEGPNDTIQWVDKPIPRGDSFKSDLLTDWWS